VRDETRLNCFDNQARMGSSVILTGRMVFFVLQILKNGYLNAIAFTRRPVDGSGDCNRTYIQRKNKSN